MKAAPTLDGRLRIDIESETDLMVLRSAPLDARFGSDSLIDDLSSRMHTDLAEDWHEFVLPDLREQFDSQLQNVIESLAKAHINEPFFITGEQANAWYGTLNQARLALENRYQLSQKSNISKLPGESQSAAVRSQFYMTLQSLILEFLIDVDPPA